MLKKHLKRIGFCMTLGQILFKYLVLPILNRISQKRIRQIMIENKLNEKDIRKEKIMKVSSINDLDTINILQSNTPDLIIVNGTRIISKQVLESVSIPFINMHAGITPKYRGVHGMYWALVNNDIENVGVTVHFVDKGIDTGKIIIQKKIAYTSQDNFITYPLLQLSGGLEILRQAIYEYFNGELKQIDNRLESRLWYHPTIWQYLYNRFTMGIK
jgi:methionyl-tRNA formyltransferase